jgi:ribose transport system permease protein
MHRESSAGTQARSKAPWKGRGYSLALGILAIYAAIGLAFVGPFLTVSNITGILFATAVVIPVTLGMQSLLIVGRFDLSVGSTATLVGMIAGLTIASTGSVVTGFVAGIIVALGIGTANSLLILAVRVDPLIATLGMMGILRSLSLAVVDGQVVSLPGVGLSALTSATWGSLPILVVGATALVVVSELAFRWCVPFRRFYAVGDNSVEADHSGISVGRTVVLAYSFAAVGAALTGLIQMSRTQSASPTTFQQLAIESIAACLIGGASLRGGRGTMLGAALGLLVVVATNNLVLMLEVPVYWKDFAIGLLLIAAVGFPLGMFRLQSWSRMATAARVWISIPTRSGK